MKFNTKSFLLSVCTTSLMAFSLFYVSCSRTSIDSNKCHAIACAHGGICNDGVCMCPSGYEDANCATTTRDKFTGTYNVTETGTVTGFRQYTLSISNDPNSITGVLINNCYNYFSSAVRATVVGDTITIPNQQLNGHIVFGTGRIYSDSLALPYHRISIAYEVIDSASGNRIVDDFGYYSSLDNSKPSTWMKL